MLVDPEDDRLDVFLDPEDDYFRPYYYEPTDADALEEQINDTRNIVRLDTI